MKSTAPAWVRRRRAPARRVLARCPRIAACYLYGSVLRNSGFRDVDAAVLGRGSGKEQPTRKDLSRLARALESSFRAACDLQMLEDMPDHLRFRILREGSRLHVNDPLRMVRFEAEVLSRFLDFKPAYDFFIERIISRESPW